MNETLKLPLYAKIAFSLISLCAVFTGLYFAQSIVTPLLISLLFAILLERVTRFLSSKLRFPHVVACLFTIIIFVLFFVGIITFLSWQISDMVSDWGKIKTNFYIHLEHLQDAVRARFNITKREQNELIDSAASESGKEIVGSTLISVTDTLMNFVLIPIYTFLILLYKTHLLKFLCKLFSKEHHEKLKSILSQIKLSVQSYIIGLFIEMLTVATLTSIGLMIIGAEYAILLGVITGILNLIPYIGILIAGVLSIAATLTGTPDVTIIFGVIIVNVVVQFIDNNFLVPMIVSSKVEINALVSIVGIIAGGTIAGVAGMFLAIPMLAILKVIFDRIEVLNPWGYLMGDDLPRTFKWRNINFPAYSPEVTTTISGTMPEESANIVYTETPAGENNKDANQS